jgi:hypothetical protein
MAYRVTAKYGVFVMLPSARMLGNKPVSENAHLLQGAELPAGVPPEVIAHLLESGAIEAVSDD